MKLFIFIMAIIFAIILFFSGIFEKDNVQYPLQYNGDTIKIANWNLQIFGDSKASNNELMNFYVSKIQNYDIMFIQEIRDEDGSSFDSLCSMLNEYKCEVSSRAGRSTSKEQYGLIYKKNINLESFNDLNPDAEDRWERPPVVARFNIKNQTISIVNIHIKPDDAVNELKNLESFAGNLSSDKTIIIGDLNADCSYFSNDNLIFSSWTWIIKDTEDTTVSQTDCAYDRIITNLEYKNYGIDNTITKEQSDHYIVWLEV